MSKIRSRISLALGPALWVLWLVTAALGADSATKVLTMKVGPKGLESLKYGGAEMAVSGCTATDLYQLKFFKVDGTSVDGANQPTGSTSTNDTVTQDYPWGSIATTYIIDGGTRLTIRLAVKNTTADELRTQLRVAALQFPEIPTAHFVDPGMFYATTQAPLGSYPINVGGELSPSVLGVSSTAACMYFCVDAPDPGHGLSVPYALNGKARDSRDPFYVSLPGIKGGQTHQLDVSFRFSPPLATAGDFSFSPARDVLDDFAKRYPTRLKWEDHRPIGAIFLASSGVTGDALKVNPRRWVVGSGTDEKVDTTTPAGAATFQKLVLRWADNSIKVLTKSHCQGMVTWDIEGQEFLPAVYYGKPQLVGKLAPEMEGQVEVDVMEKGVGKKVKMPLADAYFRKFRDAGLRVGVCLRPNTVLLDANGVPTSHDADDQTAYTNLKGYLQYARDRWGCTLFYVDSTVNGSVAFSPWVFDRLRQDFPDVLMMPENQTLRNYAVTSPLDSFMHHGVTHTPAAVRELWPKAFTILLFGGDMTHLRAQLVDGVRRGDILLFNAWYESPEMKDVMGIYKDAGVDMNTGALPPNDAGAHGTLSTPR